MSELVEKGIFHSKFLKSRKTSPFKLFAINCCIDGLINLGLNMTVKGMNQSIS